MIRLDAVSLGAVPPDDVNVIVTAPTGNEPYAVSVDDITGALSVTHLFNSYMRLPGNLGVIPHTLSDTADPLQALFYADHVLAPGMIVAARPIGVLYVSDDGRDEITLLMVPAVRLTRRYNAIQNYADLPAATLRQIAHFFCHYRDLDEHRPQRTAGWGDVNEARRVILEAAGRALQPMGLVDP